MSGIIECQDTLLRLAEDQGYLTFDDIMNMADTFSLSVSQVDRLSEAIQLRGIIVYETAPKAKVEDAELEDYSRSDYETVFSEIITLSKNLAPLVDEIRQLPPPQYGELSILTTQIANGNEFARNRLVSLYMRNALKIALSMTKQYDLDIEDAVSAGLIGLIYAVDKYDSNGFSVFPSYASLWIQQNIQRDCNPKWVDYYFPAHYKANLFRVYQEYINQIEQYEYTEPYDDSLLSYIAAATELSISDVSKYLDSAITQANRISLESLIEDCESQVYDYPPELSIEDNHVFEAATESLRSKEIQEVLSTLTSREEDVLRLRYGFDGRKPMTLEEVGLRYGVTRERIRQIEAKAIRKLNHPSRAKTLKEFY